MILGPRQYLFAYGSLMNKANLEERLGREAELFPAKLHGFVRIFNKPGRNHLYLNLEQREGWFVEGFIIEVSDVDLEILEKFEPGYDLLEVTERITGADITRNIREPQLAKDDKVLTFIAPPLTKVRCSYINRCTAHLTREEKARWLARTVFPAGVEIDENA